MGSSQLDWLKQQLGGSKAVWKVIASDMPICNSVSDARGFEAFANADDGPPLGRELELAELLRFLKKNQIRNVVFLTADVHHAAAIHYHPDRAAFKEFDPFWEFITGPMHAGSFGPPRIDKTFGPQTIFNSYPKGAKGNLGPAAGMQYFGLVEIDAKSKTMSVSQHNLAGERVHSVELAPVMG